MPQQAPQAGPEGTRGMRKVAWLGPSDTRVRNRPLGSPWSTSKRPYVQCARYLGSAVHDAQNGGAVLGGYLEGGIPGGYQGWVYRVLPHRARVRPAP